VAEVITISKSEGKSYPQLLVLISIEEFREMVSVQTSGGSSKSTKSSGESLLLARLGGSSYFGRNQWRINAYPLAADPSKQIYHNLEKKPYYEK